MDRVITDYKTANHETDIVFRGLFTVYEKSGVASKEAMQFANYLNETKFVIPSMPAQEKRINEIVSRIRRKNGKFGIFKKDAKMDCGELNSEMFLVYHKMLDELEEVKKEERTFV
jgi:hypothetical protein